MNKRKIINLFLIILFIVIVFIVLIFNIRKKYQYNIYNSKAKYTEGLIVKYNIFGKFKSMEYYNIYGQMNDKSICSDFDNNKKEFIDLNYEDVDCKCSLTKNGIEIHYFMNDNSIKNGYISDSKNYYFIFKNIYSYLEKESLAKKYFNNKFNSTKSNTLLNNKNSYIIFNGKKKYFNEK